MPDALCFDMYGTLCDTTSVEDALANRVDAPRGFVQDLSARWRRTQLAYAATFESPRIVMEDLTYIRERLDYGKYMNRRLHAWAFARLQGRVEDKATDAGIPVEYVNPAYTSKTCHECGHIGTRHSQAELRCTNDDCHVSTFQAEISAAASIAQRVDPWGESVPWKPGRDDSPLDGSGRDTAERPPKPSAPTQMTLGTYES